MNFANVLNGLISFLPEIAALTGHPELAPLVKLLEDEIARRQAATGQTRAEILADAAATFAQARIENEKLKALGHESEV